MSRLLPRGLYVITDSQLLSDERLHEAVEQALKGGAVAVQYRDKSDDQKRRLQQATDLASLCERHNARLIINDDVALAATIGADGVHIGRDDGAVSVARKALGNNAIIGVSCYNDFTLAEKAVTEGADYVAFGSFYPSSTKPHAVPADPHLLERAREELNVPVVAIGGITADNGAPLVAAGADLLAVITDIFGQADIRAAAKRISRLFDE